jgi:hypothetical protein
MSDQMSGRSVGRSCYGEGAERESLLEAWTVAIARQKIDNGGITKPGSGPKVNREYTKTLAMGDAP